MNVEKIREVYEFALLNPKRLDMPNWVEGEIRELKNGKPEEHNPLECGTTACMAGWRSIFSAPKGTRFYNEILVFPNGNDDTYEYYAAEEFGLGYDEAHCLFYHTNNLSEVRSCLLDIFNEHNETIPEWLQNELDSSVYGGDVFEGLCTQ